MSEQQRTGRTSQHDEQPVETRAASDAGSDEGFDALLDEIDGLLENNAAEYVRSFVQKGGQ